MKTPNPVKRQTPSMHRLTVQSLVQRSGSRSAWRPYEYVRPWIRLSGKWLADAGFRDRDRIVVRVASGRLVIEKQQPQFDLP